MSEQSERFEVWARQKVPARTGTSMLIAQTTNEFMRRCKIGRITIKEDGKFWLAFGRAAR